MDTQQQPLVLVIDDEAQVLEDVSLVLTASGSQCYCCSTPEEALRYTESNTPDLIISDINLDGHSGLELCEKIKAVESCADVPVMFLSGAQIPDIIRRSHAVGGSYYLRKPFDPDVLTELVDKALWIPPLVAHRVSESGTTPATEFTGSADAQDAPMYPMAE